MADQSQGQDPPEGSKGAPALDEEAITRMIATNVNAAFTARSKKLKEELTTEFKTGFDGITKQLEALAANSASKDGGKGKKGKDGAPEDPDTSDPQLNGLKRQMADMKTQLEARDKELAGEKAKQKLAALRQSAREELGKLGIVEPSRVKAALATLEADGRLGVDDDGQHTYIENKDSAVDLPTGIRAWGKTEDAKIFIPASGARGSGDRPGQSGAGKPGSAPKEATDADLGLALVAAFGGNGVPMG